MQTRPFTPPVIKGLIAANALVFLLEAMGMRGLIEHFALWPLGAARLEATWRGAVLSPLFEPWQIVTYAFLHGGLLHLAFNMFALWMFGSRLAWAWGTRRFLAYFMTCVVGAALLQLIVATAAASGSHHAYPTVGASGGIFGVLLAFGMRYPNSVIMLLFPPIPMKAKYFVIFMGALELFFGVTGTQAGVAHFAHLGGMLFGYLLLRSWLPRDASRG